MNTTTKNNYITVTNPVAAPVANFTANISSGLSPLVVQFTDTSTSNPTSWNWSFGDNTYSTVKNPVHTYSLPGSFTIRLNATNTGGSNSTTKINYITVLPRTSIHIITQEADGSLREFVNVSITGGNPVLIPPVSPFNSDGQSTDMGNYGPLRVNIGTPVTITLTSPGCPTTTVTRTFAYSPSTQVVSIPMTAARTFVHFISQKSDGSLNPYAGVSITGGNPVLTPPVSPYNSDDQTTDMGNYGPLMVDASAPVTVTLTKTGFPTATIVRSFVYSPTTQEIPILMTTLQTPIHIISQKSDGSLNPYVRIAIAGGDPVLNSPMDWYNANGQSTDMGNYGPLLVKTGTPVTITLTKAGYTTTTVSKNFSYSATLKVISIPMTGMAMGMQTSGSDLSTNDTESTPTNSTIRAMSQNTTDRIKRLQSLKIPIKSQNVTLKNN
jgi:PKD repeat protein